MPLFVPFQRDPCHCVNTRLKRSTTHFIAKSHSVCRFMKTLPTILLPKKRRLICYLLTDPPSLYFACCEQQSGCIKWWREDRYDDYYYDMHEWSKIGDRGRDGAEWRCKSLDFSTFYTHTSSIHIHLTRKTCAHTDDDAGDKQSL